MIFSNKKIMTEDGSFLQTEILGLQKYKEIYELLKKYPFNGKFQKEKEKTKKECTDVFLDSIKMNEKDWNLLTLIKLFDRQTYEHSIGTFIIAREKIDNALENGTLIKKWIETEIGDVEIFYRACLFHDVGKMTIPKFILNNSLTESEWVLIFYKAIKKQKNRICFTTKKYLKKYNLFHFSEKLANAENPNEILHILKSKGVRPVQVIPLRYGISRKELKRLRNEYNLKEDLSLADLMQAHEEESYNILFNLGYKKEAVIAGNHGNGGDRLEYPNASKAYSSMQIGSRMSDIVDLIYLADVQNALESERYYHKSFAKLKTISYLISDVYRGAVDKMIAGLWVKDEFEKLKKDKNFQNTIIKLNKNQGILSKKESDIMADLKVVKNFLNTV